MKHLVAYGLPGIIVLVSIPLVLNWVPPNRLYGFRTPRTLSSPDVWYPANRASGWFMIATGLLALGFNLFLSSAYPDWPEGRLMFWMANAGGAAAVLGLIASLAWLRRL